MPAPAVDGYLDGISAESREVLNHFGAEAPKLLNAYACTVEDALFQQAAQTQQLQQQLQNAQGVLMAAAEDNAAYHHMLTNPHTLAAYVNDFFGANGVYPVELPRDRLAADIAAGEARLMGQPQVQAQAYQPLQAQMPSPIDNQPPAGYQRPVLDVQAPGQSAPPAPGSAIDQFMAMRNQNPQAAALWLLSQQGTPGLLGNKPFIGV